VNPNDTTGQRKATMQEFGFEAVPLGEPGAPTPGRIAERLGDIATALEAAVATGDLGAIANCVAELGRLRRALDAWEEQMKGQESARLVTVEIDETDVRALVRPIKEFQNHGSVREEDFGTLSQLLNNVLKRLEHQQRRGPDPLVGKE
jgi:hypothetical protein